MTTILVLYDSREGLVEQLAAAVAEGVEATGAMCLRRRVEDASVGELLAADGLVVGSPNWSGITGRLKTWFDESGDRWETGELAGKPAGAFAAGYSPSGGLEATLLQLLHLVLAHGMIFVGQPWSPSMRTTGSYYGPAAHGAVTPEDLAQARALGERVARLALRLAPVEA